MSKREVEELFTEAQEKSAYQNKWFKRDIEYQGSKRNDHAKGDKRRHAFRNANKV